MNVSNIFAMTIRCSDDDEAIDLSAQHNHLRAVLTQVLFLALTFPDKHAGSNHGTYCEAVQPPQQADSHGALLLAQGR